MSVCSGIAFKMAQAPWTGFSSCSAAVEMVAEHVQAATFMRLLARQLCSCEVAPPGVHRPSAAAPGCRGSGSSYHGHGTARAICASGAGRQTTQAGGQASGFKRAACLLPAHELLLAAQPLLLRQIFPQLH